MQEDTLRSYQARLETEKRRLVEEIEKRSGTPDFGSDTDHGEEEADEAEEFQNQLGIVTALKGRVNEIDLALGRIASDGYGVCESCGKDISKEVLDVVPESELCAACKTKEAE